MNENRNFCWSAQQLERESNCNCGRSGCNRCGCQRRNCPPCRCEECCEVDVLVYAPTYVNTFIFVDVDVNI